MISRPMLAAVAGVVALAMTSSCSSATDPHGSNGGAPTTLDSLPRALSVGETKVVGAANSFSFDLFRRLSASQNGSNVFASPLSASMALGMTMNGAASNTLTEMRSTLDVGGATEQEINESYKSLIALLRGLDAGVDFRIANSVWYENGFPVTQSFLDAATRYFDAQVSALDFTSPSAPATINEWVSRATAGRIPTILDQIDDAQVMFLINAIYFKGSWRQQFDPAQTHDAQFHGVAGDQPMKLMHRVGAAGVLYATDYVAVDLPYGNGAYSMTIVLPAPGKSVETLASSLTSSGWATLVSQLHDAEMDISLPRLTLEWERDLVPDLQSLGMHDAFVDHGADFTRLSPVGKRLFIGVVKQKTYLDVNEEGTEAAAVTNVGVYTTSLRAGIVVDRPFVLVIRERLSGTVLFMGKIVRMP